MEHSRQNHAAVVAGMEIISEALEEMAEGIIKFFGGILESAPYGHSFAMCGILELYNKNPIIYACKDGLCRASPQEVRALTDL